MASILLSEAEAASFYRSDWKRYDHMVRQTARKYRIDPRLVHAVIWQESNYNSRAISSAGAQGLMQLMPQTARELRVWRPFSPRANIDGGVRYLIKQINRFGSLKRALHAYNCGPTRVASGRVPRITIEYANQVIARFHYIKRYYSLGRHEYRSMFVAGN